MFLIRAVEETAIKGKDAALVANILIKMGKEFKRLVEKENAK